MASEVKPEWKMTDGEALRAAILRLTSAGVPEQEIRAAQRRWTYWRKMAQNPAGLIGMKY
jgi:hypothetical protein